jgi:hypothetical protein
MPAAGLLHARSCPLAVCSFYHLGACELRVGGRTLGCAVKGASSSLVYVVTRPMVSSRPAHDMRSAYGRSASCSASSFPAWKASAVLAQPLPALPCPAPPVHFNFSPRPRPTDVN